MGFPESVRQTVYQRANYCCERCGIYAQGGSVHHRRPRGMGGDKRAATSTAANALLLCGSGTTGCHGWVESNREEAYARGLLVRRHDDPAAVPVELLYGTFLLNVDGGYDTVVPA